MRFFQRFPKHFRLSAIAIGLAAFEPAAVSAASLQVEPITLDLAAPASAGIITLSNDENAEMAVQVRVFRWTQVNGKESLLPTTDVVASPPIVRIAAHQRYVVRVVRVSKVEIRGEDSYRIIVDQLPSLRAKGGRTVNVLIRHSIPVFFHAAEMSPPDVTWTIHSEGKKVFLNARNDGEERLRIAAMHVTDGAGRTVILGNGLIGYALGRSSIDIEMPPAVASFIANGPVVVSASTNKGPLRATAQIGARR